MEHASKNKVITLFCSSFASKKPFPEKSKTGTGDENVKRSFSPFSFFDLFFRNRLRSVGGG